MRSTFLYFCFGWFSLTVPQKPVQGYFWETELKMNCKSSTGSTFLLSAFLLLTSYCRRWSCSIPESCHLHYCIQAVMLNVTFVIFLTDKLQMVLFFFSCRWNLMMLVKTLLWQLLSLRCLDGLTSRSCYRRWSSSCLTLPLCVCFRWSTPRSEALPKGCTLTIWSWVWCCWPEDVMRRRQSVSYSTWGGGKYLFRPWDVGFISLSLVSL